MAAFGASYPVFFPVNRGSGIVIGKLVAANLTVALSSGELYADDKLSEQASGFVSGVLVLEAAPIFGAAYDDETEIATYSEEDTPPVGVIGYYKRIMRDGVKLYKAFVYPKARAVPSSNNAQTKGSGITFQTSEISFTILPNNKGDWRKTYESESLELVLEWLNLRCGISGIRSRAGFNRILFDKALFGREEV